jgi:hypothetical protein
VSRLPRRRLDLRTARGRGRPTSAASPWSARRYGDALGVHCAEMEDPFGDLYSRAAARTRGFFRGVRVGATRIRCGPMLMPLRSSYRAPAYPARALASAAAEHVPALDDELGERVLDRRARLLRPVKQRRRRSIQRYRFPCEHHDFEVADAAPGRCSRTEPGIPRAATLGASRCGRDVSPIAERRARETACESGSVPMRRRCNGSRVSASVTARGPGR